MAHRTAITTTFDHWAGPFASKKQAIGYLRAMVGNVNGAALWYTGNAYYANDGICPNTGKQMALPIGAQRINVRTVYLPRNRTLPLRHFTCIGPRWCYQVPKFLG